jgi:hypothetical protein
VNGVWLVLLAAVAALGIAFLAYAVDRAMMWWDTRPRRQLPGNLGDRIIVGFDGSLTDHKALVATRVGDGMVLAPFVLGRAVRVAADFETSLAKVRTTLETTADVVRRWQRQREVKLAGLGSRYYVRGGLECQSTDDVSVLVQSVLRRPLLADQPPILQLMPPTRRETCELAVEAMKGWVLHHDGPDPVTRWHWWGNTHVKVGDW